MFSSIADKKGYCKQPVTRKKLLKYDDRVVKTVRFNVNYDDRDQIHDHWGIRLISRKQYSGQENND